MFNIFKKSKPIINKPKKIRKRGIFNSEILLSGKHKENKIDVQALHARTFQRDFTADVIHASGVAMDDSNMQSLKSQFGFRGFGVSDTVAGYFAQQSFIGYQTCALLSQNSMIDKACSIGAEDAVRNGYEVTINKELNIPVEVLDEIREQDKKFRVNENLVEFAHFCRVFGIRIAIFKVESNDKDFYTKPFNIEGVTPNSYKGISQIDPYWITPELDAEAAGDPASIYFYEPTYWRVNGIRYHRSHLILIRYRPIADILKPTYFYGGISLVQQIFFRVFCAETTSNEAPHLALTKRTNALHVDLSQAIENPREFEQKLITWVYWRDNYALKVLDLTEKLEQFDTSLADLDALIMTQWQLVAAIANIPAVKLMGTSPKGFNATGEYEQRNYHEMLRSMQTRELAPLLERHHLLLIKSHVAPKFNVEAFPTSVNWNPLDSYTTKELAELNKLKSETDQTLINTGAIDGQDVRQRIVNDPNSGYNGITEEIEQESPEGSFNDDRNENIKGDEEDAISRDFYNAESEINKKA